MYMCYYNIGKDIPKNKPTLSVNACFSSLFRTYEDEEKHNAKDTTVIVPLRQSASHDQEWIFTEDKARMYLNILKKEFGGITKVVKTTWPLKNFTELYSRKVSKEPVLAVIVDASTIKHCNTDKQRYLAYKSLLSAIRYLYEVPYTTMLKSSMKIYDTVLKGGNRIPFMDILLNIHKRSYKRFRQYGTGHSFATPYEKDKLHTTYLKFNLKYLNTVQSDSLSNISNWNVSNLSPELTNKKHLKILKSLMEK